MGFPGVKNPFPVLQPEQNPTNEVAVRMALKAVRAMAKYGKDKEALWGIQAS